MVTEEELVKMEKAHLSIGTLSARIAMSDAFKGRREPQFIKDLQLGIEACELFKEVGLCKSHSEAKSLIRQGGLYLNGERVKAPYAIIKAEDAICDILKLQRGKKRIITINVKKPNIDI